MSLQSRFGAPAELVGTGVNEIVCFAFVIAQPSGWAMRAEPAGELAIA